jgi:hypothetical protein
MRQLRREFSVNTIKYWILGSLMAGSFAANAAAPVAMRVEVEPLRQAADKTRVAVVIQVSPEDRSRLGSNVIVRIELVGGKMSFGSPKRAVRLEDDGSTRIEVEWPPGEHDLRVEIEDPSKEDSGIWVGKVRIPDFSPGSVAMEGTQLSPEPSPEAASAPVPETTEPQDVETVATVPAAMEPEETSAPEVESTEDSGVGGAGAAVAAGAAAATVPEPSVAEKPSPQPDRSSGMETAPEVPELVAVIPESAPEEPPSVVAEPEAFQTEEPDAETEFEPEATAAGDDVEQPPIEEPVEEEEVLPFEEPVTTEEELPIVEPLRADPSPQTVDPQSVGPSAPAAPAPVTMSAEVAARHADWEKADSDTRDLSVVVTRGREPALGLDVSDLRLRVGGSEAPIERLGDAENSPLLLGLAVDVASGEVGGWSGSRGSLAPLAERASGGRGRLFVATSDGVGGWGSEAEVPGQSKGAPVGSNVARLVIASLEPFAGQRGRTFLVVLTDGRNEPTKAEWNEVTDAAAAAGVPILVVALWDDDFSHRTRKNLKQLTTISGGSLFLVQGSTQLDSAADRFGRLLDGSYALRFRAPSGPQEKATSITVTASDKSLDVTAPKSIR